jgi:hypothetical protein
LNIKPTTFKKKRSNSATNCSKIEKKRAAALIYCVNSALAGDSFGLSTDFFKKKTQHALAMLCGAFKIAELHSFHRQCGERRSLMNTQSPRDSNLNRKRGKQQVLMRRETK